MKADSHKYIKKYYWKIAGKITI